MANGDVGVKTGGSVGNLGIDPGFIHVDPTLVNPASITEYVHVGASQGWECPNCHHVYSPWQYDCTRCPGEWTTTTTAESNK